MISHSLKQIVRSLRRHKSFTFINLAGLSVGIAAVVLIYLIADYEKRFDKVHSSVDSIYRVVSKRERGGKELLEATVPYPTARFLRSESPGLKASEVHYEDNADVRIGTQTPFVEKNIVFADSLFLSVLDFGAIEHFLVSGNAAAALSAPGKVVLTQSAAIRYFGTANPIGQTFKINTTLEVEVAAVVKDPPPTSHLPFTMLVSYASLTNDFLGGLDVNSWTFRANGYCYVRLGQAESRSGVERALQSIVQKNGENDRDKRQHYYLQPFSQIHFDPAFDGSNPVYTVSPKYLNMLLLLGCFIILIACINYINLSTSFAFTKAKEVGIRKTIGATRPQLFFFYMLETLTITVAATLIGFVLAFAFLPSLNALLDKSISFSQLATAQFVVGAVAAVLLVSFLSGVYPALILAGFRPIDSLKNQLATPGKTSGILRQALVVFQFSTAIALIASTIIIAKQMQFSNSKSLGFNKEAVVEVSLPSADSAKMEAFRSRLQNQSGIQQLSFCLGAPISKNGFTTSMKAPELPEKADYNVRVLPCDRNYLAAYGIKLVAGRWFFESEEKNLGTGLVVNETLVKTLGVKTPAEAIGKKIEIGINDYNLPVIGVVQDFHTSSLHDAILPTTLMPFPYFYYAAGIRLAPGSMRNTLPQIEAAYEAVYPDNTYKLTFVDERLAEMYLQDTRNYSLFKAFSGISIFICCIGLWGLIAFVVVRKTKEIGIRKVLGATVPGIVRLLSWDFLKLVALALLISSPVAWYFMDQWLQNFAYRIHISWWLFALAGFFAIAIALLTISFQAIKAATANPVKSLRTG